LPEKYRAPLLLCCLAGRTRDEAAEQLGWTLGALKMRLERGRQLLRTRLARRGLALSATLLALVLAQQATPRRVPAWLATTHIRAAFLFAAGNPAGTLSAQAVSVASFGLPAGASKAKLLSAMAGLLSLLALASGLLVSPPAPESPPPPPGL